MDDIQSIFDPLPCATHSAIPVVADQGTLDHLDMSDFAESGMTLAASGEQDILQ